jgi:hypothetical protein
MSDARETKQYGTAPLTVLEMTQAVLDYLYDPEAEVADRDASTREAHRLIGVALYRCLSIREGGDRNRPSFEEHFRMCLYDTLRGHGWHTVPFSYRSKEDLSNVPATLTELGDLTYESLGRMVARVLCDAGQGETLSSVTSLLLCSTLAERRVMNASMVINGLYDGEEGGEKKPTSDWMIRINRIRPGLNVRLRLSILWDKVCNLFHPYVPVSERKEGDKVVAQRLVFLHRKLAVSEIKTGSGRK